MIGTDSSTRAATAPDKDLRPADAVTALRHIIHSGEIAIGEHLREDDLSEHLGFSPPLVRAAIRTLVAEGVASMLPDGAVVVAALDVEELTGVFLVLGALEALAAQLACQRITEAEIAVLTELQAELELRYELGDRARYTEINRAIHSLIVHAARNQSLLLAWRPIVLRAEAPRALYNLNPDRWASSVDAHRKIFAALMARDGHLLSSLMQAHFADSIIAHMLVRPGDLRAAAAL